MNKLKTNDFYNGMNQYWTYLSWTMTLFSSRAAVQPQLCSLYHCKAALTQSAFKKRYINKCDLTWHTALWSLLPHMLQHTLVLQNLASALAKTHKTLCNFHQFVFSWSDISVWTQFCFVWWTVTEKAVLYSGGLQYCSWWHVMLFLLHWL